MVMKRRIFIILTLVIIPYCLLAQTTEQKSRAGDADSIAGIHTDTLPKLIPFVLPESLFIPSDMLIGDKPWCGAPILRPTAYVMVPDGFSGSIGFGQFHLQHPEKFFSTLFGYDLIDVPEIFRSEQMMLGNTFRLSKKGLYFMSGILYGAQLGVLGNNWGMGTREGLIWRPDDNLSIMIWSQYYQSVSVYVPVMFLSDDAESAAVTMPATPEVFSFGVQASFVLGEFIIGLGTSVAPVPFQKRHHPGVP